MGVYCISKDTISSPNFDPDCSILEIGYFGVTGPDAVVLSDFDLQAVVRSYTQLAMSLKNLSLADLKQIQSLIKKKAALLTSVAKIDRSLEGYESEGEIPIPLRGRGDGRRRKAVSGRRRGKKFPQGQLKIKVIKAIKGAGKEGIAVTDLAAKLKTKYQNISTWFHTTGKKVKEIKKVGPGKYAWHEG